MGESETGTREVQSFIMYPEVKDKATAVLSSMNFGLTDWGARRDR